MIRRLLFAVFGVCLAICVPLVAGAQIMSAASGSWTVGSTWVGGAVPDSADDVQIQSGHTVSVDDNFAVCNDLSFAADDALIDMNANSMLTVYGDVTIASTGHTAFSGGWSATNAYIKFAGAEDQVLSGWSTSGGSTSFRDVIIDKVGESKVTTDASGMRLGIQNSLEIINGTLELAAGDDIEGRWASSGNFTNNPLPNVIIQSGGQFDVVDGSGAHHIRSGVDQPIGTWTVHGWARFRDASSFKINFTGIDIEDGGKVVTSTGCAGGELEFGIVNVKSGGELENYTTSDIYGASVVFTLNDGGIFDTKSSTTIFPASFTNDGTVRYSRDGSSDQQIVDMDYKNLEVADDVDNVKIWDLAASRAVSGDLTVDADASFVITAGAAQTLTVDGAFDATGGSVDASDSDVTIVLGASATLAEAAGAPVLGRVRTTRDIAQGVNETFGGIGLELDAAGAAPGLTQVTRVSGVALSVDTYQSIERYFDIVPANNSGLDATVVFHYDESELNGISEISLDMFSTLDGGTTWSHLVGTRDETGNTVTGSGVDALGRLTLAGEGASRTEPTTWGRIKAEFGE